MPTTCEINFENNVEKVYYGGQLLSGTVSLTMTSEKSARGVYVEIYGKARTFWSETRRVGKITAKNHYSDDEQYLYERTYFAGGPERGSIVVKPGTYNYTFQCMLPAQLPTSMEGSHGWIRYGARIVIDYPFWPDKEFNEPFTVINPINLNLEPGLREPAVSEKVRRYLPCVFLYCWLSGPLRIIARSPVGGYTPGQTINLSVNVYNESDRKVTYIEARLIKQITFYAIPTGSPKNEIKKTTNVIASGEGHGCNINQNNETNLNLIVPATPPTDCTSCKLIHVKYYIEVEANPEGCCSLSPTASFPIMIGTYPIQDVMLEPPTSTEILSSAPLLASESDEVPYSYNASAPTAPPKNDLAQDLSSDPPTYEEAIADTEHNGNNFKPKYPMFRRQTSYSIEI